MLLLTHLSSLCHIIGIVLCRNTTIHCYNCLHGTVIGIFRLPEAPCCCCLQTCSVIVTSADRSQLLVYLLLHCLRVVYKLAMIMECC